MSTMLSLRKKAEDEGDAEEKKEPMNTEPVQSAEDEAKAKEEKAQMEAAEEQKRKEEEERKKAEAEPPLSADELRRKRLERLQTGAITGSPAKPAANPKTMPALASPQTPSPPQANILAQRVATPSVPIAGTSFIGSSSSPGAATSPLGSSPLSKPRPGAGMEVDVQPLNEEDWRDQTIKFIFQVTLSHQSTADKSLYLLNGLLHELANDKAKPQLTPQLLDRILVERLSAEGLPHDQSGIDYLVASQARLEQRRSQFKAYADFFAQVTKFIVSYTALALSFPDMFNLPARAEHSPCNSFVTRFVAGSISASTVAQIVEATDKESFSEVFRSVFVEMTRRARLASMMQPDALLALLRAMTELTRIKSLASLVVNFSDWCPPRQSAKELETCTLVSRYGILTHNSYFKDLTEQPPNFVKDVLQGLRDTLSLVHAAQYDIVFALLRPETREQMVAWLGTLLDLNMARVRMNPDRATTSTDGFLLNLNVILLRLCAPFMEDQQKMNAIDPAYPVVSHRIDFGKETRLVFATEELNAYIEKKWPGRTSRKAKETSSSDPKFNFMTEMFFYTLRCFHVGYLKTCQRYIALDQAMKREQGMRRDFLATRNEWRPEQVANHDAIAEKMRNTIENIMKSKFGCEAQLLDPNLINLGTRFMDSCMRWLIKQADGGNMKSLVNAEPTPEWGALPEHFVEDIADYFSFLGMQNFELFQQAPLGLLLEFLTIFIGAGKHIKNPYLRSKLVDTLTYFAAPSDVPTNVRDDLANVFERNSYAQTHLASVLMNFYVDIEFTGSSRAFYDKFNVRYAIAGIVKFLWELPGYRAAIKLESQNEKMFSRFVNCLLNDAIYLWDESTTKLAEIRNNQIEIESGAWRNLDPNARREREESHQRLERQVRSYMMLTSETVQMLYYLSREIVEPFLRPELIDRVAAMLDYFISQLAGPKVKDIAVHHREKYSFNPAVLLERITSIFVNFSTSTAFAEAVARDERSYKHEVFVQACEILRKTRSEAVDNIARFEVFVTTVLDSARRAQQREEEMGDVPDDFLDPVLQTLMNDPVILPSSGQTMDRSVITRHLLSDPRDPFNRAPLIEGQLKPNVELKKKIDEWKASKMQH